MKFSQYNYIYEDKNGLVIVNIKNSKYVKIKDKAQILHLKELINDNSLISASDDMAAALKANNYIVDYDLDEYAEVKKNLKEYLAQYNNTLTIFLYVTEQCNFRCVYCPEQHVNKTFSDENWEALYRHIEKGISDKRYTNIKISFFGGEPLLKFDKIINFLEKLELLSKNFSNVLFEHHITTNGYLLTPQVYDKLVSLHVKNYQITVDGFDDTHNYLRPLVGGQPSWEKIIENVKYINTKDDNTSVVIRTNYSNDSVDKLNQWKKWEEQSLTNAKFIFDYVPVSRFSKKVPEKYVVHDSKKFEKVYEDKLLNTSRLVKPFSGICNSAHPNYYSITTDGKIARCETLFNDNNELYCGYMDKSGEFIFRDDYKKWTEDFETELCPTCIAYPVCCARRCPAKKAIYPDTRPDCAITRNNFTKNIENFIKYNVLK